MIFQVCALLHCCWYIVWFWRTKNRHYMHAISFLRTLCHFFIIFLLHATAVVVSLLGPLFTFYFTLNFSSIFHRMNVSIHLCIPWIIVWRRVDFKKCLSPSQFFHFSSQWHGYETHELNCVGKVSEILRIKKNCFLRHAQYLIHNFVFYFWFAIVHGNAVDRLNYYEKQCDTIIKYDLHALLFHGIIFELLNFIVYHEIKTFLFIFSLAVQTPGSFWLIVFAMKCDFLN